MRYSECDTKLPGQCRGSHYIKVRNLYNIILYTYHIRYHIKDDKENRYYIRIEYTKESRMNKDAGVTYICHCLKRCRRHQEKHLKEHLVIRTKVLSGTLLGKQKRRKYHSRKTMRKLPTFT